MSVLSFCAVLLVAVEHFFIFYLETFAIDSPTARRVFKLTASLQPQERVLFANLGLYNAFLGAGLLVGLLADSLLMQVFGLLCVLTAAIYGAISSNKSILFKQGLPALIALILLSLR